MTFKPGQSGNPFGRSKGYAHVAKLIGELTDNGRELARWAYAVWQDPERTHAERAAAHAWLSDRYLGKPLASHEIVAAVATQTIGPPPGWELMGPGERKAHLDSLQSGAPPPAQLAAFASSFLDDATPALPPGDED